MTTQFTNTQREQIITALQHLAGVCDGAASFDGAGFNKFDTTFGRSLAEQETLSETQLTYAFRMCRKYSRQLDEAGLPFPEIEQAVIDELIEQTKTRKRNGSRQPKQEQAQAKKKTQTTKTSPATKDTITIRLHTDKQLAVTFDYNPLLVEKIKSLPEKKPVYENGKFSYWEVSRAQLPTLLQMFPDASVDKKLTDDVARIRKRLELSRAADGSTFHVDGLHGTLYPFQRVAVEFGTHSDGRFLCADDMGLGKTMIAIALAQHYRDARPVVIVVPNSVKINWEREINKWVDGERIVKPTGRKVKPLRDGSIYLLNWEILTYWADALIALQPQIVIFDEAHYMKNKGSKAQPVKRTAAGKRLAAAVNKVIMLTGTPITNRPAELWPLLNMLYPKAWPSFWQFAKRYCGLVNNGFGWDFGGATNLTELHERIQGYVIRRTKEQVLPDLPAKTRATVVVQFDEKLRTEYFTGIRQAVAAAEAHDQGAALVYIEKAKQVTARAKLKASIDWIRTMAELEKLVVFVHHHFVADAVAEALGDRAVIATGQQTAPQKQDAIDRFQSDDRVRVIIASEALQEGVTLTASSNVVHLEFSWTPGAQEQKDDRTHRIGQKHAVMIWNLVAENTIDEYIIELLEAKRINIDMVMDGVDSGQEFSIVGELLSKLRADLEREKEKE